MKTIETVKQVTTRVYYFNVSRGALMSGRTEAATKELAASYGKTHILCDCCAKDSSVLYTEEIPV